MRKVTYGDNGELLDAESGEVVGRKGNNGVFVPKEPEDRPKPQSADEAPAADTEAHAVSFSKYEVTPQSEFTVRFCLGFADGRVRVYAEDAYLRDPDLERHWVKFRMWKYDEELSWQNRSMEYQGQTRSFTLNQNRFNELKIRNLIKAWSFEEYDAKFRLLHVDGVLSDESYDIFRGFFPAIINCIIHMMNQVLEQNG